MFFSRNVRICKLKSGLAKLTNCKNYFENAVSISVHVKIQGTYFSKLLCHDIIGINNIPQHPLVIVTPARGVVLIPEPTGSGRVSAPKGRCFEKLAPTNTSTPTHTNHNAILTGAKSKITCQF